MAEQSKLLEAVKLINSKFKNKETGKMEKPDASLEHAAQREFWEEAGLDIPVEKFAQIKTYSHMFDPRLRIIDTAFVVHIPGKDKKKVVAGDDAADVLYALFSTK